MDIRNFFTAKKLSNKNKIATEDTTSPVDNNDKKGKTNGRIKKTSSNSSTDPKPSKIVENGLMHKKKDKDSSTKKRKIIIESDYDEEEIIPSEFFAQPMQQRQSKEKASSRPAVKGERKHVKVTSLKKEAMKKRIRDDFESDSFEDEDFECEADRNDDDTDDDEEEEFMPPPVKSKKRSPKSQPSPKKPRKPPSSTSKNKGKETIEILEPSLGRDSFDLDSVQVPEFLAGLTFVFTGIMEGLNRDDAADLVKTLGGRVTSQLSGKTSYLVIGEKLEDGRPYEEGSKYRKATTDFKDKTKLVMGEKKFYGLCHMYHEKSMQEKGIDLRRKNPVKPSISKETTSDSTPSSIVVAPNPYAKALVSTNKTTNNPYAKASTPKVTNPYAKAASVTSNPYVKTGNGVTASNVIISKSSIPLPFNGDALCKPEGSNERNDLWVDRYKPTHTRDILGNKGHVTKLQNWLKTWEKTFLNGKASKATFSNPKGPWKAALLSGPPGIGSTSCNLQSIPIT
jgi:replication factor C subunit 1